jgi:hypothetical protein
VKVENGYIDVVEQFAVVLHTLATREEDDNLFLEVLAEESEEEEESFVGIANDVTLFEVVGSRCVAVRIDVNVERSRAERHAGEIGNLGSLGSGEKHGLTVFWKSSVNVTVSTQGCGDDDPK